MARRCLPNPLQDRIGATDSPLFEPNASQLQITPPLGGVPTFTCQTSAGGYMASDSPSSSGQDPLPMAVVEMPNICINGTCYFTESSLYIWTTHFR